MSILEKTLRQYGQTKLLEAYSQKNLPQTVLDELATLDWEKVREARELINSPKKNQSLQPVEAFSFPAIKHPSEILKGKKIGCIVMAGGQATRLNGSLPKGLIPVSPVTHKTTLQMIAEKVLAYSISYQTPCFLAIMTSDAIHEKIISFFSSNNYFGLAPESVSFFKQNSLPALDEEGQILIKNEALYKVPDGNGGVFQAFFHSPTCSQWEKAGVNFVSLLNSDNPLIDPFLPNMFEPLLQGIEMTGAAVERSSPDESVGVFVRKEDKITVAEYSEIDPAQSKAKDFSGNLLFKWANISFFACTFDACKKAAQHTLPLHLAKKTLNGMSFWKAEYFVFDHCPLMSSFSVVPIQREFFAPIKTLQGPSSPEEVGKTLLERDKKRFFAMFKKPAPENLEFPEERYYTRTS